MTGTATARATIEAIEAIPASMSRLVRVRELWSQSKDTQLEIGRLLYEERAERLGAGGRGVYEGFHQWLRDAGIPKTSAYRRIAEYEVSIGERDEADQFDKPTKPVPSGTTLSASAPIYAIKRDRLTAHGKKLLREDGVVTDPRKWLPKGKTPSLEVICQCIRRFGDCTVKQSKGTHLLEMKLIGLAPEQLAVALEAFNTALGSCDDCIDVEVGGDRPVLETASETEN